MPTDIVRRTFKHTTQIGILPSYSHLQRQFKSPNPTLNIHRRNEADDNDKDDNTFQDAIQVEDVIDDTEDDDAAIYGKTINNEPIGTEDGAKGVTVEYEGVLHAQYCHYGELYY